MDKKLRLITMKPMYLLALVAIILNLFPLILCSGNNSNDEIQMEKPTNASIIVMGLSGSGISSTVRQLLGPRKTIVRSNPTEFEGVIQEYSVPLENKGYLKIVDVKGMVEGQSYSQDALILETLRSYIKDRSKRLGQGWPNFFLVISKFDDARFSGDMSMFIQTLKRVQIFQKELYGNATFNTALLLTRMMSNTKSVQRNPKEKVERFRNAIRQFTSFPAETMEIIVGENLPEEYDLEINDGDIKLPNKEIYPQNVFNALLQIANFLNDTIGANSIVELNSLRSLPIDIIVRPYSVENLTVSQLNDFDLKIHEAQSVIKETELSKTLREAFNSFNETMKNETASALTHLEQTFQSNNITNLSQLPKTTIEKVTFFQNQNVNPETLGLLSKAFDLSPPKFFQNPVVGYGYDVTQDENLHSTPYAQDIFLPSTIGYLLPDFLSCTKLPSPIQVDFSYYGDTLKDYFPLRLQFLHYKSKEIQTAFEGKLRTGFNIKPQETEVLASLSTVREVRVIQCEVNTKEIKLNEEFMNDVNELSPLNVCDRESVKEWRSFFSKYGTHIVSSGYGGGSIEGLLGDNNLKEAYESVAKINETLEAVVDFRNVSFPQKPSYRYFGGYIDSKLEEVYSLDIQSRQEVIDRWKNSLKYDPSMLQYEMKLTSISEYVKLVNKTVGEAAENGTQLMITNKLVFIRSRKDNQCYKLNPIRAPQQPSSSKTSPKNSDSFTPRATSIIGIDINISIDSETSTITGDSQNEYVPSIRSVADPTQNFGSTSQTQPIAENASNSIQCPVGQGFHIITGVLSIGPLDLGETKLVRLKTLIPQPTSSSSEGCYIQKLKEQACYYIMGYFCSTPAATANPEDMILQKVARSSSEGSYPQKLKEQACNYIMDNFCSTPASTANPEDMILQKVTSSSPEGSYPQKLKEQACNYIMDNFCSTLASTANPEDMILQKFGETNLSLKENTVINRMFCQNKNVEIFNTYTDYVLDLVTTATNLQITKIPKDYKAEMMPWVSIRDDKSYYKGYRWEEERIILELTLEESKLSAQILNIASDLPSFIYRTRSSANCTNHKQQWKQFFDTYGTHFVKSAFIGQSKVAMANDEKALPVGSSSCQAIQKDDYDRVASSMEPDIDILKSSIQLEKISLLFSDNIELKNKIDEALYELLENGMECITTDMK